MPTKSQYEIFPGLKNPGMVVPTRSQWLAYGRKLADVRENAQWAIGDWLILGRECISDAYNEAEKITGLARQTLLDIKRVAERFPAPSRRREPKQGLPPLSWSHHKEVSKIEEPEKRFAFLNGIEAGLSVQKLRKQVNEFKSSSNKVNPRPTTLHVRFSEPVFVLLTNTAKDRGLTAAELVAEVVTRHLRKDDAVETALVDALPASLAHQAAVRQ